MQQTLLLVDDEPNVLSALKRVFQEESYQILTASSGLEGLELLTQYPAQVIVSDQRMPNMTGSQFLIEVKKLHPDTVRIILSGYADFEAVKSAINEGTIYKFFSKPWDEDLLRKGIREAFMMNEQQKKREQQLIRLMRFAELAGLNVNTFKETDSKLIEDLNEALEKKQFILFYQPIVIANTGKIKGAEALLYWQHPTRGLLDPGKFIALCEETGLIIPITHWVMETACQQLKQWQTAGYLNLSIAVNLSAYQLNHPGLLEMVTDVLQKTQISAHSLELEITETLIMYNLESNLALLKELQKLGVQLSLDDFGTGYSSLSYLKNFPFNILKIDKSFIQDMTITQTSLQIVTTIITLAKTLGFKIIAEGVETVNQLAILKEKNCDFCQGYFFSKPVSTKEFTELLRTEQ